MSAAGIEKSESQVEEITRRALWWPGPTAATWAEAHNSAGATSTGVVWGLAEGEQGGDSKTETYILLANTSPFDGSVRVTLFLENGTTLTQLIAVKANSRTNIPVGAPIAAGGFGTGAQNQRFGALIESLVPPGGSAPAQPVVERAMYSNAGTVTWAAGTNALATKLQ